MSETSEQPPPYLTDTLVSLLLRCIGAKGHGMYAFLPLLFHKFQFCPQLGALWLLAPALATKEWKETFFTKDRLDNGCSVDSLLTSLGKDGQNDQKVTEMLKSACCSPGKLGPVEARDIYKLGAVRLAAGPPFLQEKASTWRALMTVLSTISDTFPGMCRTWTNITFYYPRSAPHRVDKWIIMHDGKVVYANGCCISIFNAWSPFSGASLGWVLEKLADQGQLLELVPRDCPGLWRWVLEFRQDPPPVLALRGGLVHYVLQGTRGA
jgi:hypothetical protein